MLERSSQKATWHGGAKATAMLYKAKAQLSPCRTSRLAQIGGESKAACEQHKNYK